MYSSLQSRWMTGFVLVSVLSLPAGAAASEDLEIRVSALEAQVNALAEKVETLSQLVENAPPAASSPTRDLKRTWMLYDSRGAKRTTEFWPDFWSKRSSEGN